MSIIMDSLDDPKLADLIIGGAVGIIPTDTICGLVASANNAEAAERILQVKGREKKPGTMIASSIDQLVSLGIKKRYLTAVESFWPGPISVILPVPPQLDYLHAGRFSLPVRVTDHARLAKLLDKTGPLITTSANLPDQKPSESVVEAKDYFGESVDFYVDVGLVKFGPPSTIIQVLDDAIEVIREGAVKIDETGRIIK